MRVGVFYFPTDYGIDIAKLARALEERGFTWKTSLADDGTYSIEVRRR